MMNLEVKRGAVGSKETRGSFFIDGEYFAPSVEPGRDWKKGPIAAGSYTVVVTFSPKFQKPLPLLLGVPDFVGIRIHGGTKAEHTEGCICIPLQKMALLMAKLNKCIKDGDNIKILVH